MDPITILSTIGTFMTVAKVTVSGLQSLIKLKTKYENVNINDGGIVSKVQVIQFSLSLLENWARFGEGKNTDGQLIGQLEASIKSCIMFMSTIHNEVSVDTRSPRVKDKLKYFWKENTVKDYDKGLDSQMLALQFVLVTPQLQVVLSLVYTVLGLTYKISTNPAMQRAKLREPKARTILDKARDTASIYDMDALTIHEGPEDEDFASDDMLLNSATYRAAFKRQIFRNDLGLSHSTLSNQPTPSKPSPTTSSNDTSIKPTAATRKPINDDMEAVKQDSSTTTYKQWKSAPLTQSICQEKLYDKLCIAAREGNLKLVKELAYAGVSVEGHGACLLNAIDSRSIEVVSFFLSIGANLNTIEKKSGQSCLHYALGLVPKSQASS